jgi:phage terminase large subunit-like protein
MNMQLTRNEMRTLAFLDPAEQDRVIRCTTVSDALKFDVQFENWAHDNQLPPKEEGWRTWLLQAGRGFGKTRAGAEWVNGLAMARRGSRIALVGANIGDARSVMVEGTSGLLAVARAHGRRLRWEPSLNRLTWPNGSVAELFSGDNPDGLRGPEHDFAWCDELAKWRDADEAWDNLQLGMRRGTRPRTLVTTTPKSTALMKRIVALPWTVTTRGRTSDNINLDEKVVEMMIATYGGTRVGRQELDGELIEDVDGSLWPRSLIEQTRVAPVERAALDRVVVGVDPPVSVGPTADACGIVVAGSSGEMLYVLEDATVQGLSPEGWANRVAAAAARWDATLVVAEANNGGVLVESVLKAAQVPVKLRLVHASRGKCARAEPVALKFEAGKAFLAGRFPELEDELSAMVAGGGAGGRSPDRADAMVWAMTALSETQSGLPRVRRL